MVWSTSGIGPYKPQFRRSKLVSAVSWARRPGSGPLTRVVLQAATMITTRPFLLQVTPAQFGMPVVGHGLLLRFQPNAAAQPYPPWDTGAASASMIGRSGGPRSALACGAVRQRQASSKTAPAIPDRRIRFWSFKEAAILPENTLLVERARNAGSDDQNGVLVPPPTQRTGTVQTLATLPAQNCLSSSKKNACWRGRLVKAAMHRAHCGRVMASFGF